MGNLIGRYSWDEVFSASNANAKVGNFHDIILGFLETFFPKKRIKISEFDKKWFNQELKMLHRQRQREYFRNGKSQKWRKLKTKFQRAKRKNVRKFYDNLSCELLKLNPRKFFTIAKRVSSVQNEPKMMIPDLEGCSDIQTAEKIAEHFSAVSNQYKPVNLSELPVYLPALKPPQVTEYEIYQKLRKLKSTKSTNPLDLPVALRKEYDIFLASPLTDIINTCLKEQIFPEAWKLEIVTPIPKIQYPHNYSDLRKISCTSDYSKLFESVLKEFILKDINSNLPLSQYGGRIGVGTEHLIVNFIDRVLNMLDSTRDKAAVLASAVDWTAAFDRVDPTKITQKFIKIGIRPSLIPILISYLSGRKMVVKFKSAMSL